MPDQSMSAILDTPGLAVRRPAIPAWVGRVGWAIVSIGLFVCIWEACWALGWADKRLLPPPHIFLGNIPDQAKFFNTISRWQVGQNADAGPPPALAVFYTAFATITRGVSGLVIASILSVSLGVAIRYFLLFERLTLPMITLLAPVSPIACASTTRAG